MGGGFQVYSSVSTVYTSAPTPFNGPLYLSERQLALHLKLG